jgi:hypothetical protein
MSFLPRGIKRRVLEERRETQKDLRASTGRNRDVLKKLPEFQCAKA